MIPIWQSSGPLISNRLFQQRTLVQSASETPKHLNSGLFKIRPIVLNK